MSVTTRAWDLLPAYVRDADTRLGLPLRTWLSGVLDQCAAAEEVVDAGPLLGDPAATPRAWLEWLSALGGVDVTGVAAADLRAFLVSAIQARGSVAAVGQRVGLALTGSRTVIVEAPYTTVDTIRVTTFTAETPDTAARDAAARLECPAWMVVTTRTIAGMTYTSLGSTYSPYSVMTATGKTYATLGSEI